MNIAEIFKDILAKSKIFKRSALKRLLIQPNENIFEKFIYHIEKVTIFFKKKERTEIQFLKVKKNFLFPIFS